MQYRLTISIQTKEHMFTDHIAINELPDFHVTSLEQAITLLEFTKDENGLYFYDAGHDEPWEACEGLIREQIQTSERYQPELPEDGNEQETRYHHDIRVGLECFAFILEDILARPGYIPIAQRPVPQWKIDFREGNVSGLKQALAELELTEKEDGTFFYDDEDENIAIVNEEYCIRQLKRFEASPIESDEGIDFYPYHNVRRWKQAYRIVIEEIRKRSA